MSHSLSERRKVENEVVFREYNERIKKGFDELKKIAKEDKQEDFVKEHDIPLNFYCECCDNNCKERIKVKQSVYDEIHTHRDRFIVLRDHECTDIERVVSTQGHYCVVEKFAMPPATATTLHEVDVDNTK